MVGTARSSTAPRRSTAPVLAVLVCHDGDTALAEVLSALRGLTVRPRHVLAVDTGSADRTAEILAAEDALDGVLTLQRDTGFGTAVAAAVEHANARWGDPGRWLWVLHDDSAPEPDCLRNLLGVAELDSSAAVLGPLGLDWDDPRLVVDGGLSTDASGHRQTGIGASELDPALVGGAGESELDGSGGSDRPLSGGVPEDSGGSVDAVPDDPGMERDGSEPGSAGGDAGGADAGGADRAGADSVGEGSADDASVQDDSAGDDSAEVEYAGSVPSRSVAVDSDPAVSVSVSSESASSVSTLADSTPSDAASSDAAPSDSAPSDPAPSDSARTDPVEPDQAEVDSPDRELSAAESDDAQHGPDPVDQAAAEPDAEPRTAGLPVSEVLAVSTAGVLIRRDVFERLGGFDTALPIGFEDVDFGWRVNSDGHLVLCVPGARMRHAGLLRRGERAPDAAAQRTLRAAERVGGVRTFLVNSAVLSFVLGVPRLLVLATLRAAGFALLRRWPDAAAELSVLAGICTGRMGLRKARAARREVTPRRSEVRGLLTSRLTRLRNGLRAAFAWLVRERVRRDVVLGRVPSSAAIPGSAAITSSAAPRPVGPEALPAGALPAGAAGPEKQRRVAGLRRPAGPVVVPLESAEAPAEPAAPQRPSPVPRGARPEPAEPDRQLLLVEVNRWRVLRELLLAPPVVLTAALVVLALVTHGLVAEFPRFGGTLQGGRLLPVADLSTTWRDYLASWHPVNGGTGSPAPAALLVLAIAGTVLAPIGGPAAVVGALLLFGIPLAGLNTYAATRALPMSGRSRALAAGAYALLPLATLSAGQGRLDVVVAHVLVPPLLAGIAAVIGLTRMAAMGRSRHWLSTACLTALGLAVLGAFAPLVHVILVVLALVGFVAVPSEARRAPRRVAGLAALVLLPVACLLPWPVVLLRHPEIFAHGLGARFTEAAAGGWLAALSPAPAGLAGALLVLTALLALVLAPRKAMLPGAVTALVGWAAAVCVDLFALAPIGGGPATTGATGAALTVAAAGLLWMTLSAGPINRLPRRAGVALLTAALLVTGVSAVLAGRGPLRTEPGGGTPALAAELAGPGALLVLDPGPQPARLVDGSGPRFGDDDLVPVSSAVDWLRQSEADVLSGDQQRVRSALAAAAARGAGHVAVPAAASAEVQRAAGEMVVEHGRLGDGSVVLRVLLPTGPVQLLGPDLARQARLEAAPSPQARPIPVPAATPEVAVRVSAGGVGRALVLAAEHEPGWQVVIDGREAPLAKAWGHQVAVPLPEEAGEVRVDYSDSSRAALLVVQAAALLFTAIAALPSRRSREPQRPPA
uniref:glycosyltransferase family 2 protein n=1 Tax=Saccharopolyspora galaxeae TaxID=2781241 RepID=UPI0027DD11A3|nr:glycosyltransferase [Saccharopolyspora sp. HNM0986]